MAWWNKEEEIVEEPITLEEQHKLLVEDLQELEEKLNPGQPAIRDSEGHWLDSRENVERYKKAYENLELVSRAINMIIDDAAEIPTTVGERIKGLVPRTTKIKMEKVSVLLNKQPNPFEDISSFKRKLVTDLIMEGNIFIYFDEVHLYHLPAKSITIKTSKLNYIDSYVLEGGHTYNWDEVIHIKENSFNDIFRGIPRLKSALRTMKLVTSMRDFQDNFFQKGAVTGLVLKTDNTLSERIKDRMLLSWRQHYNPRTGGARPMILDGGMSLDALSKTSFKDLDFETSILNNYETIINGLGVPYILIKGGNNANIRPNHRLYYLETVLPIVQKIHSAIEVYFGYELVEDVTNIPALQPEMRDQASFVTALVNGGIMTPNEGRAIVGLEKDDDPINDEIRIPTNIAGSAVNPDEGGKPPEGNDD